jgi:hypothetical protein
MLVHHTFSISLRGHCFHFKLLLLSFRRNMIGNNSDSHVMDTYYYLHCKYPKSNNFFYFLQLTLTFKKRASYI